MRSLTKEQVSQYLKTGHYIMRGQSSNKRTQAQRDWHRLQVERAMNQMAAEVEAPPRSQQTNEKPIRLNIDFEDRDHGLHGRLKVVKAVKT
jgi:hypothetical protein